MLKKNFNRVEKERNVESRKEAKNGKKQKKER